MMMIPRLTRRVISRSLRPAARTPTRLSNTAGRRFATTDAAHAAKESSDTPWIVSIAFSLVHLTVLKRVS